MNLLNQLKLKKEVAKQQLLLDCKGLTAITDLLKIKIEEIQKHNQELEAVEEELVAAITADTFEISQWQ